MRRLDMRSREENLEPQLAMDDAMALVALSVSARSKQPPPDCETCGACCVLPLVVALNRSDEKRLKAYWDITTDDVVIERVLGRDLDTGRCVHLDGVAGKHVSCNIYPDRPHACRAFEAGSDRCLEYRRMCGIDPQLTEEELKREQGRKRLTRSRIITETDISVASTSTSIKPAPEGSPGFVTSVKTEMQICVAIDGNKEDWVDVYHYDPVFEEWHESEFYGLTLDEARSLIAERKASQNS